MIRWAGSNRMVRRRGCHFLAVDGQEGPDEASRDIADHVSGRGVTVVTIDLEPFDAQRKQACGTSGEEE